MIRVRDARSYDRYCIGRSERAHNVAGYEARSNSALEALVHNGRNAVWYGYFKCGDISALTQVLKCERTDEVWDNGCFVYSLKIRSRGTRMDGRGAFCKQRQQS